MRYPQETMSLNQNTLQSINKMVALNRLLFVLIIFNSVFWSDVTFSSDKPVVKNDNGSIKIHKPIPVVMFKINGFEFTVEQYAQFLQGNQNLIKKATTSDEGKAMAVREMAGNYLLREAIFAEGLLKRGVEPDRKELIKAYEELATRHFPRPKSNDQAAAYSYYEQHPSKYGIGAMVRLNQIRFAVSKSADKNVKESIRERAVKSLQRINEGAKFSDVAVSDTDNPVGKVAKGDIGYLFYEETPWLKNAIKDHKVGDILGIVETPEGYEILQITEFRPALISPYANVSDQVASDMADEEQNKLRIAYIRDLSKDVKWEIVEPTLKPVMNNQIFP